MAGHWDSTREIRTTVGHGLSRQEDNTFSPLNLIPIPRGPLHDETLLR
jgi:hypothetical protein